MYRFSPNTLSLHAVTLLFLTTPCHADSSYVKAGFSSDPHSHQVSQNIARLSADETRNRTTALESLGYLRAYTAGDSIAKCLTDGSPEVRREAAMILGWCGGRSHIQTLLKGLHDVDWTVRQAAWVSLTNLTGKEFPFDALQAKIERDRDIAVWIDWWKNVPAELPADDALSLQNPSPSHLDTERAFRARGALGGKGAADPIVRILNAYVSSGATVPSEKRMVQAGIRALGRLQTPEAIQRLIELLKNPQWARYAAEALGDSGNSEAANALLRVYPNYAVTTARRKPLSIPLDDKPGFEAVDRMYETPHAIAAALCRLPLDGNETRTALRQNAIRILANLPGDFDGAMLYEPEARHYITAYLLEKAGIREAVRDIALLTLGANIPTPDTDGLTADENQTLSALARSAPGDAPFAASWLPALNRGTERLPQILALLTHDNGWVRINSAKVLMFANVDSARDTIATLLKDSKPEAAYGYFGGFLFTTPKQGQDDYNAPSPCWREAYTRALGVLSHTNSVSLLVSLLNNDQNVLEVQHAAAISLDAIGSNHAIAAIKKAEAGHPFHSIRLLARESLWKRGLNPPQPLIPQQPAVPTPAHTKSDALVFIKGSNQMPNNFQIDIWRQTYSTTDSGPTYRLGTNLFLLSSTTAGGKVTPLTSFKDGYVADCEVSWDGTRILFARRGGDHNPWWHLYDIRADGSKLRQLTSGPYHDVQPTFLPDGRIVFSSTRIGTRDEYHGYPATGLTVMNADGSDIHCIGFNLGRDNEPSIMHDGRITFSRLDLFYSRLKTEITVQAAFPDGTKNVTLYGPERRTFWHEVTKQSGERYWGEKPPRHRVLRTTQPQSIDNKRILCTSTAGPVVIGPGQLNERIIPRFNNMAVTSPFPLDSRKALCSASVRTSDQSEVDLGIYRMDIQTGRLTLIYNDPDSADFEARPLSPRTAPPVLATPPRSTAFTARLLCVSARNSRDPATRERGKYVRIIEGQPVMSRHHTHTNSKGEAWKNHVGTRARVLGTVPLASDGSFFVEVPADRLMHCQILDSDRQVVGNQLIWMYARPGETKSCVGCHERPDTAPQAAGFIPSSALNPPTQCLPTGGEFSYRAKAWQKGHLSDEAEERTRIVNAINLMGRH